MRVHRIIGTPLLMMVAAVALIAWLNHSIVADAGDKTRREKVSAEELEKLVKDLGSSNGATREDATRRLGEIPSSRHYLRRNLKGRDPETLRRMEELIQEHARSEFKRQLSDLAKENSDAPIDLVVELLLQNKRYVGDEQWKQTVGIVNAISAKIRKQKESLIRVPVYDFTNCKDVIGDAVVLRGSLFETRVIAHRLAVPNLLKNSVVVLRDRADVFNCSDTILLMNGQNPPRIKKGEGAGSYGGCFIYCDTDFFGEALGNCVVISKGRVYAVQDTKNLILENAHTASKIRFFTPERIGLHVKVSGKEIIVASVVPNSRAAKAQFAIGDILLVESTVNDVESTLVRRLREAYVQELDCVIPIERDGKKVSINFSFGE